MIGTAFASIMLLATGAAVVASARCMLGRWQSGAIIYVVPATVVVAAAYPAAAIFDFVEPSITACLLVLFAAFPLAVGEWAFDALCGGSRERESFPPLTPGIAWLGASVLLVLVIAFGQALGNTSVLGHIVQDEFQSQYASGVSGLLRPVAMLLVALGVARWGESSLLMRAVTVGLTGMLAVTFVKGTLLLPLVAGMLIRAVESKALTWTSFVVTLAAAAIGVFTAVYAVEIYVWGDVSTSVRDVAAFGARKFVSYAMSGILGLSLSLQQPPAPSDVNPLVLVAPLHNVLAWFVGWIRIDNALENFVVIDLAEGYIGGGGVSNVRTLPGTLLYHGGASAVVVGLLGTGFVVRGCRVLSERHVMMRGFWGLLASSLFFGWFEYYYWHALFFIAGAVAFAAMTGNSLRGIWSDIYGR